jgi:hypothetical protein
LWMTDQEKIKYWREIVENNKLTNEKRKHI